MGHPLSALDFDGTGVGVVLMSEDGTVLYGNLAARHLIGGALSTALAPYALPPDSTEIADPDGVLLEPERWPPRRALCDGIFGRFEVALRRNGATTFIEIEVWHCPSPVEIPAAPPSLPLFAATLVDVTRRRDAELRSSLAQAAIEASDQAIVLAGGDTRILAVNKSFEKITGYSATEVVGRPPSFACVKAGSTPSLEAIAAELELSGQWRGDLLAIAKSGRPFHQRLSITALRDRSGAIENYIGIFSDRTEHHDAEERIQFLANFDPLTRLANRNMLERLLGFALADARRKNTKIAVLFIDIDNFKLINDSLGHSLGDLVLVEMAARLRSIVRETDIVARQGGDEFIVILNGLAEGHEASRVAEKLVHALDRPMLIGEQRLRVGASLGISVFPDDGTETNELLRSADAAMYEAKRGGRGQYAFYSPVLNAQAVTFAKIAARLHGALLNGHFEVYYQPQVDAVSGAVVGLEALIRARDPELGSPAAFIPVAERIGLIAELGEWVIVNVCRQIRRWLDEGYAPPRIAVNVSAMQLRNGILTTCLEEAAIFARIPHTAIEVELTETSLMEHLDKGRETLDWLRARDVRIAIDDFGTGYSSLAYLQRLPIDVLKIDRSFVIDVDKPRGGVVARAIVGLAKSLSLMVVAEGVETEGQAEALRQMGCDYLQGYFYGRPMPAAAVPEACGWHAGEPAIPAAEPVIADD